MPVIKVLVGDGQTLFADSLQMALGAGDDLEVLRERPRFGLDLVRCAIRHRPDLIVVDYWIAGMQGPAAAAILNQRLPHCKVLLMSWFFGEREIQRAFEAGAVGFVSKSCSLAELEHAIVLAKGGGRGIYMGGSRVAAVPTEPRSEETSDLDPQNWTRIGSLAPREIEVLELLPLGPVGASGLLSISPKTFRNHVYNACKKLRAHSQSEALATARRYGVIHDFPLTRDVAADVLGLTHDKPRCMVGTRQRSTEMPDAGIATLTSVLVADAQPLFSHALAAALGQIPDLVVLPETPATGNEVLQIIDRSMPDVAIIDLWMPDQDGAEVTEMILQRHPRCKVIVLSWVHAPRHIRSAINAGAATFIPKGVTVELLVDAIRRTHLGEPFVYGEQLADMMDRLQLIENDQAAWVERFAAITPREQQVLRMLAKGRSVAEIARRLSLRPNTVQAHISKVLLKTRTDSYVEAITLARRCGIIP